MGQGGSRRGGGHVAGAPAMFFQEGIPLPHQTLTEDCQLGTLRSQGSFCGLAFIQGIVGELRVGDLQIELAGIRYPNDPVAWPG